MKNKPVIIKLKRRSADKKRLQEKYQTMQTYIDKNGTILKAVRYA